MEMIKFKDDYFNLDRVTCIKFVPTEKIQSDLGIRNRNNVVYIHCGPGTFFGYEFPDEKAAKMAISNFVIGMDVN